ncbi:MAG: hypothetical protein KDA91_20645 [Planctomycetaceae bacterium]|nr:hypothetical protein [Planctomycetaceae bacterium]
MEFAKDPDTLPLAERFLVSQMLARELSEHVRQTFLPRLSALRHAAKESDVEVVTDQEMHDRMKSAMEADDYSSRLFAGLFAYLDSIESETRSMLGVVEW